MRRNWPFGSLGTAGVLLIALVLSSPVDFGYVGTGYFMFAGGGSLYTGSQYSQLRYLIWEPRDRVADLLPGFAFESIPSGTMLILPMWLLIVASLGIAFIFRPHRSPPSHARRGCGYDLTSKRDRDMFRVRKTDGRGLTLDVRTLAGHLSCGQDIVAATPTRPAPPRHR